MPKLVFSLVTIFLTYLLSAAAVNESCSIRTLCSQQLSYNIASVNETWMLLSSDPSRNSLCVSTTQHNTPVEKTHLLCVNTQYNQYVLLGMSKVMNGLVDVGTISMGDQLVSLSTSATHYIKQLPEKPQLSIIVSVEQPVYGSLSSSRFALDVSSHGGNFDSWYMEVLDFMAFDMEGNSTYISSAEPKIEPGSWFIVLLPRRFVVSAEGEGAWQYGFPAYHYLEFVLTDGDLRDQQLFVDHGPILIDPLDSSGQEIESSVATSLGLHEASVGIDAEQPAHSRIPEKKKGDRTHVCVWSNNPMDGQKRIWLQQIEFMDPGRFGFSWILTIGGETVEEERRQNRTDTVLFQLLQLHNVHIVDSPFNNYSISAEARGGFDISNVSLALQFMRQQFLSAGGDLEQMQCAWCREPFLLVRSLFQQEGCEVVVYGNSRGFSTDYFIADVARSLGIRSVMELQNLFPDASISPDVIVGPSKYALQHESVAPLLESGVTSGVVIQPAVDTELFQPADRTHSPLHRWLPTCEATFQGLDEAAVQTLLGGQLPCVTIGYVGRLSVGKNPGLFLQAAYHILQKYPFARFAMIGTGKLEQSLRELAERLGIQDKVAFVGFVTYYDLPSYLTAVDIIINPSIRGWSETFCIANIEAMAMAIPLVTFAVGGIGEYVKNASRADDHAAGAEALFTVSPNAVVLHRADPAVVAAAVLHLVQRPQLRRELGRAARDSVTGYFTVQRQMKQYERLYQILSSRV